MDRSYMEMRIRHIKSSFVSELSVEEHTFSENGQVIPLEDIVSCLTQMRLVIKMSSKKNSIVHIGFSEPLHELIVKEQDSKTKSILTKNINEVTLKFSIQVHKEEENIFQLNIKTTEKCYKFGFRSRKERELFYDSIGTLLKYSKEIYSPIGLRKYCDSFIVRTNLESSKKNLRKCYRNKITDRENLEKNIELCKNSEIHSILSEIVSKIEKNEHCRKISGLNDQLSKLKSENKHLEHKKKSLSQLDKLKSMEICLLNDSLNKVKKHYFLMGNFNTYPTKNIWKFVIVFLSFSELFVLIQVCKLIKTTVYNMLKDKKNWERLINNSLNPRTISWKLFFQCFFPQYFNPSCEDTTRKKTPKYLKSEINKSLTTSEQRSSSKYVKKFVTYICKNLSSAVCYQEIRSVAEYCFKKTKNQTFVYRFFLILYGHPYILAEIWKPDLLRVKLGLFQVKKLMKIKLPYLERHFKSVKIELGQIITPWILTVFTCVCFENNSEEIVDALWDNYIIKGWPAIISGCLTLLYLSQDCVFGESYEKILEFYKTSRIYSKDVRAVIKKFDTELMFLNELEKSFYFSFDKYS